MAMTQSALLFMGALAALCTYGLFYTFADRWTGVLVEFVAAAIWGLFAVSAMDVIVRDTSFASASEPIWPLVYLGLGASVLSLLYALFDLFQGLGSEGKDVSIEGFGR